MAEESKTVKKEELSPEEKLLKVIQSGGKPAEKMSPEEKLVNIARQQEQTGPVQHAESINKETKEAAHVIPPSISPPPKKIQLPHGQSGAKSEPVKLKLTKVDEDHAKQTGREARAAAVAKVMSGASSPQQIPITEGNKGVSAVRGDKAANRVNVYKFPVFKKPVEKKNIYPVINRFLVAGILLALILSSYQIGAAIKWENEFKRSADEHVKSSSDNALAQLEIYPDPYVMENLLQSFAQKNIFGVLAEVTSKKTEQRSQPTASNNSLEETVKNLQLIGHSKLDDNLFEGIVMDKKENKMYFLKPGDKFPFYNEELDVVDVLSDRLIVKKGDTTAVIK